MEYRTAGFGLAGLVMATFAGIVIYSIEVDSHKRTLLTEKATLQEIEDNVTATKAASEKSRPRLTALREAAGASSALLQRREAAKKDSADLDKEIAELDSAIADQRKQMLAVTKEVRQQAAGDQIAEVALKTGVTLRGVRIERCGGSDITFAHAAGVTRVDWKQLPDTLISRFRFSEPPPATPPKSAHGDKNGSEIAVEDSPSPSTLEPQPPPADGTVGRVNGLQSQISRIRHKIAQAQGTEQLWRQKADEYRKLHYRAQSLGRISSHLVKAEDAAKQADAVRNQILAAENQIRKLEDEQADAIPR